MKHIIEFNLPDDKADLKAHMDAIKHNKDFRNLIDEWERYLRAEWKHGPSTESAQELINQIRDKWFEFKGEEIVDWSALEED